MFTGPLELEFQGALKQESQEIGYKMALDPYLRPVKDRLYFQGRLHDSERFFDFPEGMIGGEHLQRREIFLSEQSLMSADF